MMNSSPFLYHRLLGTTLVEGTVTTKLSLQWIACVEQGRLRCIIKGERKIHNTKLFTSHPRVVQLQLDWQHHHRWRYQISTFY